MTGATPAPDAAEPWPHELTVGPDQPPRGGSAFAELHLAQRALQDTLTGAVLPEDLSADVSARLREITALITPHVVPEAQRYDGFRPDLPGRAMPFMPAYTIDSARSGTLSGRVSFSRFHLGGNGAAHGGSIPLLFDDVLGIVVNYKQPSVSRTAYLTTNYRRVTPLDVQLTFEASLDRVEGRKRFGSGRLIGTSGDLLAEVDALFVALLPGQA